MSTLYIINNTVGDDVIHILPGALNGPGGTIQDSDLRLYGQGTTLYGEGVNENLYRITESFACPEKAGSPGVPEDASDLGTGNGVNNPVTGQPWYNTTTKKLMTYDSTAGGFINPAAPAFGGTAPSAPIEGDLWYDSSDASALNHQLKVYEGNAFVSVAERYVRLDGIGEMYGDLTVNNTGPKLNLVESDAAVDNGHWSIHAASEQFMIRSFDDADSTNAQAITIRRTGVVIDHVDLAHPITSTQPTLNEHLTRKDYVDNNFVADVGGTMSGTLILNGGLTVSGGVLQVDVAATFSNDITATTGDINLSVGEVNLGTLILSRTLTRGVHFPTGTGMVTSTGDLAFNIDDDASGQAASITFSKSTTPAPGTRQALMRVNHTAEVKMFGDLDLNNNNITNVADPVNLQDVATKNYVLNAILGEIYAVGSYFMGPNPNGRLPGTWTQLPPGTFLMASATGNGTTGGNNTTQLTIDQLPSHAHASNMETNVHNHRMFREQTSEELMSSYPYRAPSRRSVAGNYDMKASTTNSLVGLSGSTGDHFHSHSLTIQPTGGGQSYDSRPSYEEVEMWKRTV